MTNARQTRLEAWGAVRLGSTLQFTATGGEEDNVFVSETPEVDGSYWARDFTMPPATSTGRELVVTFGDDSWQRVGGGITVKGKIEEPSLSLRNGSITCNATGTFWPGELASGRTDIDGVFELQLPPVPLSTATLEWSHDSGQIRGEFEFDLSGDVIDLGELIPN